MERISKSKKGITVSKFLGLSERDPEDRNFLKFQYYLGDLLHIMVRRGISQNQLAKKMGVSRQAITDKFSGRNTSVAWLERACQALGIEMKILFVDRKKAA